MRKSLLLVTMLTLAGCNWINPPIAYEKPGATPQDVSRDSSECELSARRSEPDAFGFLGAMDVRNTYRHCMTARGYIREK